MNPNPRPLSTIHHVAVKVDDIDRAILDLGDLHLKFETVECYSDWAILKFANVFVALVKEERNQHLGFAIDPVGFVFLQRQTGGISTRHRDGTRGFYHRPKASRIRLEFLDSTSLPAQLLLDI